jgi:hypothetical protein
LHEKGDLEKTDSLLFSLLREISEPHFTILRSTLTLLNKLANNAAAASSLALVMHGLLVRQEIRSTASFIEALHFSKALIKYLIENVVIFSVIQSSAIRSLFLTRNAEAATEIRANQRHNETRFRQRWRDV